MLCMTVTAVYSEIMQKTYMHSAERTWNFVMLSLVVHIATTELKSVKQIYALRKETYTGASLLPYAFILRTL